MGQAVTGKNTISKKKTYKKKNKNKSSPNNTKGRFSLTRLLKNPYFLDILIAAISAVVVLSLLFVEISPKRYELQVGDIPTEPIPAPRDVEDIAATDERIAQAKAKVPEIYTLDQTITSSVIDSVNATFQGMELAREAAADKLSDWEQQRDDAIKDWEDEQKQKEESQTLDEPISDSDTSVEGTHTDEGTGNSAGSLTTGGPIANSGDQTADLPSELTEEVDLNELYDKQFINEIQKEYLPDLSGEDVMTIIMADERDLTSLGQNLVDAMTQMLESGIKEEQLSEFKMNLRDIVQQFSLPNEIKMIGLDIGLLYLDSNMLYNPDKTMEEKEKVADEVEKVIYKKGQYIVEAGQPVTEDQVSMLAELGLLKDDSVDLAFILGITLAVLINICVFILYLIFFEQELLKSPRHVLLIGCVLCFVLGLSYIAMLFDDYLIPASMGSMLLAILISPRIGFMFSIMMSSLIGIMMDMQLAPLIYSLVGSIVGTCLLKDIKHRNSLVLAGIGVAIANIVTAGSFELLSSGGWRGAINGALWGIASGLLSSVLTIGTLPIWENVFDIVTPTKLMELTDPNQPILKRLLMETPGTYHHSIIVANLAERAADSIGADGLLARVGAYYHDIGKLERPYYFKENQLYGDNPHDKLNPRLSAKIIISHTVDGVKLAREYKVPDIIIDFILQHHGDSVMVYFYHEAKEKDGNINIDDFRYSGPKPRSREIAIVMMADTVEAAVRSQTDHSPESVKALIEKLIKSKLDNGQFEDSGLTLGDLKSIAVAFTQVMSGIFHERVEYPDMDLNSDRKKERSDDFAI